MTIVYICVVAAAAASAVNRHDRAFQVYDSVDSMEHFGQFAAIYGNLSAYRTTLLAEAAELGYPLIRYDID